MRRIAPAMRIRETKARAGPVMAVSRSDSGIGSDVLLTWRHCVGKGLELW